VSVKAVLFGVGQLIREKEIIVSREKALLALVAALAIWENVLGK
jgi:hypothetical protein